MEEYRYGTSEPFIFKKFCVLLTKNTSMAETSPQYHTSYSSFPIDAISQRQRFKISGFLSTQKVFKRFKKIILEGFLHAITYHIPSNHHVKINFPIRRGTTTLQKDQNGKRPNPRSNPQPNPRTAQITQETNPLSPTGSKIQGPISLSRFRTYRHVQTTITKSTRG